MIGVLMMKSLVKLDLKTYCCKKGRFSGIWKTDEANISDHLQTQLKLFLLSILA